MADESNSDSVEGMETESPKRPKVVDPRGILKQNRQFLDFFWDIAKPEQEVRLKAIENLLQYLETSERDDELKYTLKRLVDGLAATREAARPGFSLALAQVLQHFEAIPLQAVLDQFKEKHNLEKVKKKLLRNAAFGNFFGVLALFQSGRLTKEPKALLESVQLLQSLAQHREHLKDLPRKTVVDILSETPEGVFEEVLFGILKTDLSSAFSTPEQLHLLLVAIQKFPGVLKPKKLKKLLGTSTIITKENVPKLIGILKTSAKSVKTDRVLPPLGLDLLRISLKEDTFELFWKEAVEKGLLLDKAVPCSFMCYRLLGSALPLLTLTQLKMVLHGEVMLHYGENVIATQLPAKLKFGPEMETYVDAFLESCEDSEKQLAVMVAFSTLINQGSPVVPSSWKVVRHLQPPALLEYVDYLKQMFISPDLEVCLELYTRRQKPEKVLLPQQCVFRLRKWIVSRLASIIDNPWVKKDEDLVMDITRFIFFHAFFEARKSTPDIPETECRLSVSLDEETRNATADSFFSLLHYLNCLPVLGGSPEAAALNKKHVQGVTADGNLWIYCVTQYANALLSQKKYVKAVAPFTDEQRETWDRMLLSVDDLRKKGDQSQNMNLSAFQQLELLIGIHLFKAPVESLDLLKDFHSCMQKVPEKPHAEDEPEWVEVVVEILLSLLSQPSRFIRQVCTSVFKQICPNVTQRALQLILDVLDPEKDDDEESALVITDEMGKRKAKGTSSDSESEDGSDSKDESDSEESSGDDDSSDSEDKDDDDDEEDDEKSSEEEEGNDLISDSEAVDENFRIGLMKVLQAGNAVPKEDEDSDEEDMDDEAMLELDKNLAALFAEQKKRAQEKKDEKDKIRKERILVRDFKIKVLDLIDVFLKKQPENPLIFGIIEPLLSVIERSMSGSSDQQEQDFLQKTADIFINQLCKAKRYCRDVSAIKDDLHNMMERLMKRARKQSDSSVALYCFSASLYLFRVLRGNVSEAPAAPAVLSKKKHKAEEETESQEHQVIPSGSLDVDRVTAIYQEALTEFMTKRNSALTGTMFVDLFVRFPILCLRLLDSVITFITEGVRQHQQGQACLLVQKALQTRELRQSMTESEWEALIKRVISQLSKSLNAVTGFKVKVDQEKVLRCLELTNFLVKTIRQQKLNVELTDMVPDLLALTQLEGFGKSVQLDNIYWNIMKPLGFPRPKKKKKQKPQPQAPRDTESTKKKKKGFLPETKKRKNNRKKECMGERKENCNNANKEQSGEVQGKKKKKRNRKRKREQSGEKNGPGQSSPAKQSKMQIESRNKGKDGSRADKAKKKKKKLKTGRGAE